MSPPPLLAREPCISRSLAAASTPLPFSSHPHPQVLLNKIALSSFSFSSANSLLFFQCFLCVVAVKTCSTLGLVKTEPFKARLLLWWGWHVLVARVGRLPLPPLLSSCLELAFAAHASRRERSPAASAPAARLLPPYALRSLPPARTWQVEIVRIWLPVNVIFVGMIGTSFWALRSLNVGMVTGARRAARLTGCSALPVAAGRAHGAQPRPPATRA